MTDDNSVDNTSMENNDQLPLELAPELKDSPVATEVYTQLANLRAKQRDLKAKIAPINDVIHSHQAKMTEITQTAAAVITDLYEQLNKVQSERDEELRSYKAEIAELNNEKFQAAQELRRVDAAIARLEAELARLLREKMQSIEFKTLEAKWDQLTMGAPWREWAKDHQIEAGKAITYQNRKILADSMGLGKTLSSIIALDMIKSKTQHASPENPVGGEEKEVDHYNSATGEWIAETKIVGGITKQCGIKILYFCPATMLSNVEREIKRWAPHRSVVVIGGMPKAERNFVLDIMKVHPEYVVICNYEAWRRDKSLVNSLIDVEFDTVIVDEAHNIKNRKSSAYKGIKRICHESNIPFVIPMTGTPVLNRPQELYSLLTLVAPNVFKSEAFFLQDYCQQNDLKHWVFRPGGEVELAKRISPFYMRRTKDQAGIVLPPKTINIHAIEIDEAAYPNQARARNEMRRWGSIMLDPAQGKAIQAAAKIAVYTRLRQIEVWPAGIKVKDPLTGEVMLKVDIEESQKIDEVIRYERDYDSDLGGDWEGLIPEVINDERVVLFSQFKEPLAEIKRRCEQAGLKVALMTGDTSDAERDEIHMDFDLKYTPLRSNAKYDIVLCHYRVGGVGVNLTGATQMIVLDEEWSPGKRDQAYDRIHRMGQDKPVTIHVLRSHFKVGADIGGIDNWLASIIDEKEEMIEGFNRSADELAAEAYNKLKSGLL